MKTLAVISAAAALFAAFNSGVQAADDFYKGKTIKMIMGGSPGGSYDTHARILARHMPRFIPGNPQIVVQAMPAAAGLVATNHIYNLAVKDGTEIGLSNRYNLVAPMLGNEQARYKVSEMNWLGTTASYSDNAYLFVINAKLPHKNIDDLRNPALPALAVGNVGSAPIRIFEEALGVRLKVIEGYTGNDLDLAFERGEVDGHTVGYSNMLSRASHWVEKNFVRIMIQSGRVDRLPALKDVPTARELTRNKDDLALVEFTEAPLLLAYPFVAPPGVPADRVALLRKAFKETTEDKEFQAEMVKSKMELSPKDGNEIQAIIDSLSKASPAVIERYKSLVKQ